jgi:hypothetical protein
VASAAVCARRPSGLACRFLFPPIVNGCAGLAAIVNTTDGFGGAIVCLTHTTERWGKSAAFTVPLHH